MIGLPGDPDMKWWEHLLVGVGVLIGCGLIGALFGWAAL